MKCFRFRRKLFSVFLLIGATGILAGIYLWANFNTVDKMEPEIAGDAACDVETDCVSIVPMESFSTDDIEISIHYGKQTQEKIIFYTLDGREPTTESLQYTEPIAIKASDELQVVVVRASVLENGVLSKPVTQTYFVGKNVDNRFSTKVVSIVTEKEGLYGYEEGIFVTGKVYDEWLAAGGSPDEPLYKAQANFNQRTDDWIREAHVEVFLEDGEEIVDLDVGISVGGNATSSYPIKSINIKADEKYDVKTSYFNFVEDGSNVKGEPFENVGEDTNSVRLRNGGNDFASTMIRQSICNELAIQSGLEAVSITTPVVVFINGEYYSLLQAQNNFSASNIGKMLSLETDYIEEYDLGEKLLFPTLNKEIDFTTADFNDPLVREAFERIVDPEEFFLYYAIEIMVNNGDWPNNNYKVIRYTGEEMDGNPYSDGRIHYLFFDTDWAFQLYSDQENMFEVFFGSEPKEAYVLTNMIQYESYKQMFVNTICDLLATSFEPENVAGLFDKYLGQIEEELPYLTEAPTKELEGIANGLKERVSDTRLHTYQTMLYLMPSYLYQYFGAERPYKIYIDLQDGKGTVECNTVTVDEQMDNHFVGTYYCNYPISVKASAKPGYVFSHFVINGEEYKNAEFLCTAERVVNDELHVEAYFEKITGEYPIIHAASGAGEDDWIELSNPFSNAIDLKGLYLSDDSTALWEYSCPEITLQPGESIRILDKNNPQESEYRCSLGLKAMETIYLSDSKGIVRDKYFIPR